MFIGVCVAPWVLALMSTSQPGPGFWTDFSVALGFVGLALMWTGRTGSHRSTNMTTRPNATVVHVLEHPSPDWGGESGYLDSDRLARHLPAPMPAPMLAAVESALVRIGAAADRIHTERFDWVRRRSRAPLLPDPDRAGHERAPDARLPRVCRNPELNRTAASAERQQDSTRPHVARSCSRCSTAKVRAVAKADGRFFCPNEYCSNPR